MEDPEVERFCGYTLFEAVDKAIEVGSHGAWTWLQAWWKADLEPTDPPPSEW